MTTEDYKFDVAFSFLAQDEPLATQLNDLLQDRIKTFLYSKKQGELAGTDGERTFNLVFEEQARLVVVLYRDGWGQTPWTRIEETAIRNRAFERGYGFVKFIPLDDKQSVPKWLPRTQLWVGLKRWGIAGAASVIEARIEELGGEPDEETVENRATRLERSMRFEATRNQFLHSAQGVDAANKEFESLRVEIDRLIGLVVGAASSIALHLKANPRTLLVLGFSRGLSIHWGYHYRNSLDDAELEIALWDRHPPFPGVMHFEKPKKLRAVKFKFDLLQNEQVSWVSESLSQRIYSTNDLASFILKYYMDNGFEK
jgi:hypothetical protein